MTQATPQARELHLGLVDTAEGFLALRDEWNRIAAPAATVFLQHGWLHTWLEIYGTQVVPTVLTARSNGSLVAALPLVTSKGIFGRRLEFMGAGTLTPNHLDLIAQPEFRSSALAAFTAHLVDDREHWDVLDLDKMPERSDTVDFAVSRFSTAGCTASVSTSAVCPCAALPSTYEEFVSSLPRRLRRSLAYRTRRLCADHPDAFFHQAGSETEVARALDALERLSQARWQARGYRGSFADPRFARFQKTYAVQALAQGALRIHTLTVGDSIIGVTYGFRMGDCVQVYMTAFDTAWADYSPGSRVMARTAEMAIAEGATSIDLLEGCEEYKDYWTDSHLVNVRLRVYNSTAAGAVERLRVNAGGHAVTLARHTLPESVRLAVRRRLAAMQEGRSR